jgi:hypothetical protein
MDRHKASQTLPGIETTTEAQVSPHYWRHKASQTLPGIETIHGIKLPWRNPLDGVTKPLKPFQGLKHELVHGSFCLLEVTKPFKPF